MTSLFSVSNEPLEDIKYLVKVLGQCWSMYLDRENIGVDLQLEQIEVMIDNM